ncbi:hypothetical protein Pint_03835 [Pistacia integerrima]|uniref:Uncharacterized protein n=1 Tax=Pistacia integerrima TaxID=434235 RepID=A0ACC0Z5R6_9ROSI|nr:hypothetical protein Pint_03835 [Pistacia integerrima]
MKISPDTRMTSLHMWNKGSIMPYLNTKIVLFITMTYKFPYNHLPIRTAVVTGANKGIGLEICRQLASNGVKVILTARAEKRGHEAVKNLHNSGVKWTFCTMIAKFGMGSLKGPARCGGSFVVEVTVDCRSWPYSMFGLPSRLGCGRMRGGGLWLVCFVCGLFGVAFLFAWDLLAAGK